MSRILIVRVCAVGDFVLHLLALEALHRAEPSARFTLVGIPERLALARSIIPVEAIHSIETAPWRRLFYEPLPLPGYDRAIVWMKDPAFAVNLQSSGILSVQRHDPFPEAIHASDHLLKSVGLPRPPLQDRWCPDSERILLHPGSGGQAKCWPHFHELAARLPKAAFLLGPAEEGFEAGAHVRFENLQLPDVTELLCHSAAFIGNDSGITHLAAYLGCPTIALFGPTDPAIWGPVGKRVRILFNRSLKDISVDDVLAASAILRTGSTAL